MSDIETLIKKSEKYFGAVLGGSYVFVRSGALSIDDIKDVDLCIDDKTRYKGIVNYLSDEGYEPDTNAVDRYGNVSSCVSLFKDHSINIHVCFKEKVSNSVWYANPIDILSCKMRRGTQRDWEHVEKIAKSGVYIKKGGK